MSKGTMDGYDREHRRRFVALRPTGMSRQWARWQWARITAEDNRADRRLFGPFNKVSGQMAKEDWA